MWFGAQAVALAGADVGDGSVIGFRSIVNKKIPNNCIAVGSPAKVVRRNIAWERPHLSFVAPPYKPEASTVTKSEEFWNPTDEPVQVLGRTDRIRLDIHTMRRKMWHLRRRVRNKQ